MFFLIFILGYIGGNVYVFIRALQMLSGASLPLRILLSVFFWLAALWLLIFATIKSFGAVSPVAANLMLPYLAWVTFAGYLNLGICFLN